MTSGVILCFSVFFLFFIENPNLHNLAKRIDKKCGQRRNSIKVNDVNKFEPTESLFIELSLAEKVAELTTIVKK